ncbi:DNA-binding protein [Halioglobus japonicus]|uniref:Cyclic nucleotide-binding domain-containing protein n=1 Tax=Halioglobus japonicus TaxID=930805 RepID=A0AAP8SMC9_9GAMM|nr:MULTISPECIES: cyclic nucleotide-binding domain-containing protein [Halioglobus]AQA17481.1 DNA-binding protein [Halioglobus japonicus]KZX56063.1 DNA-binding protein [Halioglobus sp. HI00S01]PLW85409.1 cyclic nucleotide-binding domain-containing protein [Halioglobus japonicus]GHD15505.1 cAMP-binding protein A [Halioglobus japonicus]
MLAKAELSQDFTILGRQYKQLVAALLEAVNMPGIPMEVGPTDRGNFRGFDGNQFYVIERGSLTARYQGKLIYVMEQGEILLPDIAGNQEEEAAVYFGSDAGARLTAYSALEFMRQVFEDPAAIRLWTRLLITYSGLMLRITSGSVEADAGATPGFEIYEPGEIIIRQGDRADYVFNMSVGTAEVIVDDVPVGRIVDGEIFGAMAALTQADRSATVRAKTTCSVVKVPKEQFTELIQRNPATIHSLLIDMANSIVNLNEQLVGLRG